ncbi:MAG: GAF domain-containing protein [candidate division Zixibacteria bacterium]|nr:GAF domain-containing protein [candidate division Zixibacteria bacterium]
MSSVTVKTETDQSKDYASLLSEITRTFRKNPAGRKTLLKVLNIISGTITYESATLFLMNKQRDTLEEVTSLGETVNLVSFLNFSQGTGLAAWAVEQKRALYIPGKNPRFAGVREHHNSVIILPLEIEDEIEGVLCFSDMRPNAFEPHERLIFEAVADMVALSIERIKLRHELDAKNKRMAESKEVQRGLKDSLGDTDQIQEIVELAASISNDMTHPLSTIIGQAQLIEMESGDIPKQTARRIQAIVDAARRISLITHKLHKIENILSDQDSNNQNELSVSSGEFNKDRR